VWDLQGVNPVALYFDRLIVANAKANGFAWLISADEEIARNYPRTVW